MKSPTLVFNQSSFFLLFFFFFFLSLLQETMHRVCVYMQPNIALHLVLGFALFGVKKPSALQPTSKPTK